MPNTTIKISVPLFVILPRKTKADRKVALNLNQYRNMHYIVNNIVKKTFCEGLQGQLEGLKLKSGIDVQYILFKSSKRKIDRANILCIVEKFFCDALVHYKCLPDDNDDFIKATHYYTGGISKDRPRCDIIITNIN